LPETSFVGREKLISTIASSLTTSTHHLIVITGEPGIGKTALARELAHRLPAQAIQYCSRRRSSSIEPIAFSKSISSQLAVALDGFDRCLGNQIDLGIMISVKQSITNSPGSHVSALHIENLAMGSWSAYQAFDKLVKAPLREWCSINPTRTVVLIIDAVDEANISSLSPTILDLLVSSEDVPLQLKIIVTSRATDVIKGIAGLVIEMRAADADNISDLRAYVTQSLEALDPVLRNSVPGAALQTVLTSSEGNFLYAAYVMNQLSAALAVGETPQFNGLPAGLDSFYREFLQTLGSRTSKDSWRTSYRPVIGLLTVAYDSFSLGDLVSFCGESEQTIHDTLSDLAEFLDPDAKREGLYRLYHGSFADFISDRDLAGLFWIDVATIHKALAERILRNWAGDWSRCPLYAVRHIADHLAAVDKERLLSVLLDYGWLFEAISRTPLESVMRAYSHLRNVAALRAIEGALRLSAHVLSGEPERLPEQLLGRLEGSSSSVSDFLETIRQKHRLSWLRPMTSSLAAVGGSEYRTLVSESGPFTAICFGHLDGALISGSMGGSIIVWDLEISQPRYVFRPSASPVTCLMSDKDGLLVAGHADGTLAAWDLRFGTDVARRKVSAKSITAISIEESKAVVFADTSGSVFHADLSATKRRPRRLLGSGKEHTKCILSHDGSTAAYLGSSLDVWSTRTKQQIYHSADPTDGLWNHAIALTPDGTIAVTTLHDGVLVHNTRNSTAANRPERAYLFHFFVEQMCIGDSGRYLYWIGRRGSDFGGNIGSPWVEGYELPHLKQVFAERGSATRSSAIAVSDDDKFLAYSAKNTIKVLDLSAASTEATQGTIAINRIVVAPDGSLAVCTIDGNGAVLYDIETATRLRQVSPDKTAYYRGPGGGTYAAAFSSSGREIVIGSYSGALCALNAGRERHGNVSRLKKGVEHGGREFEAEGGRASALVFLEGDRRFACTNEQDQIIIWDITEREPISTINAHKGSITKLVVNRETQHLVSCSLDGFIRVWDWKDGTLVREFESPYGAIHDVALTPSATAYVAAEEPVVLLVDLDAGRVIDEIRLPKRDDGFVSEDQPWRLWRTRVAVSAVGDVVATTLDNQVGFLRDDSRSFTMSNRHHGTIRDLAVDTVGKLAVTCSSDGLVNVWDVRKAVSVASFRADADVRACGITPDGTKVICGEVSGRVHVLEFRVSRD
jgi:WD40 repeat protein